MHTQINYNVRAHPKRAHKQPAHRDGGQNVHKVDMQDKTPAFKGDGNKWLTEGLFLERSYMKPNRAAVVYTLNVQDRELEDGTVLPSLHKAYVAMGDLAEHAFAEKYFACYSHWLQVREKPWFKPYYEAMRAELRAKIASESLNTMIAQVEAGTASQATLKYLADMDYLPAAPKGRPAKKRAQKRTEPSLKEDMERVGLIN